MKYAILVALIFVLQTCSIAHTQSIPEQEISMPRAQLPLYICCLPLSPLLLCCELIIFELFYIPWTIARALIQISKTMLSAVESCIEAPIICLEDLTILLRDLPGICGAVC